MKTIQFHQATGMLAAVLEGRKTQTVRSLSNQGKYHVGEVLAVVEPYYYLKAIQGDSGFTIFVDDLEKIDIKGYVIKEGNPDSFLAMQARNFIKITGITVKKPCKFTETEFKAEGVYYVEIPRTKNGYHYLSNYEGALFNYQVNAFWDLFQAIYGIERGAQLFESEMVVFTFERCTREGDAL